MKIKKFTAPNMQEAMRQMKRELGENAVILHTRKLGNNGMLPIPGKGLFEITAALDEPVKKTDTAIKDNINPHLVNKNDFARSFQPVYQKNDVFYEMIKSEMVDMKEKLTQIAVSAMTLIVMADQRGI